MPHDLPSLETQLAVLALRVEDGLREIGQIRALIEGPPWERSVRGRLHTLEAEGAAATLAAATLAEARRERRQAQLERARGNRTTRTFRWKAVGAATAFAIAVYPYLSHFAHWGS